jgi:hypothetical protein
MKKLLLLVLVLLVSALMWAQSPFDGTWVTKLDTAQLPQKPEVYAVQKGMYSCSTCVPAIDVKADGSDQSVSGSHYFDTISIHIVNASSLEITSKKGSKSVYKETDTVSPDGNTLTEKFSDQTSGNPEPVTGEEVYRRVSNGPAGSHAVSGSWRAEKFTNLSSNGLSLTYQGTADGLKMSNLTGQSYDAKFDGKEYPMQGDPGHTMVTLKRIDANTVEETDKRDGKVVGIFHVKVAKDGKSIDAVFEDKERDTKTSFTMHKQS